MLSMIKGIINQKKDFLEAAEMILESEMNNLDDLIILGEETALPDEPMIEEDEPELDDEKNDSEESDEKKPEEDDTDIVDQPINDDEPVSSDSDDIMDSPIGGDVEDTPAPTEEPASEPASEPVEEPMPIPGNDELPEPVSNVTGEPVADDNILSMELDLASNTPKDILPIPPASAGDAVVSDDLVGQRIDSGFGGESTEDIDDIMNEAITIADAPEGEEKPAEAAPTEEAPATDTSTDVPVDDTSATEEPAPDNDVTAAVKDKVAEAEAPTEAAPASKEELMKKLSALTTGLEKAKELVMKSI